LFFEKRLYWLNATKPSGMVMIMIADQAKISTTGKLIRVQGLQEKPTGKALERIYSLKLWTNVS
jgi:hypothetical protein